MSGFLDFGYHGVVNQVPDQDLLRDFAATRSEAAFAEIVRRHVDLVHSTAMRLMVDPHLAEDVTQAVFSIIAMQAAQIARKLAKGAPFSGWLHLTTRNLAAKAVRTEVRRRSREQEAAVNQSLFSTEPASAWDQIAPHLDTVLAELSVADRDALLLRFFERKTAREIGEQLGMNEDAAQKRIQRALERLRERFAARGVAVSSAAFASVLAAQVVQASPVALAGCIIHSVIGAATLAASGGLAASAAQLLPSLTMTKTQTVILLSLAATIAIPLGVQQLTLSELRASLGTPPAPFSVAAEHGPTALTPPRESETDEIARLRHRADELRRQLAAKQAQSAAVAVATPVPVGATMLDVGRRVDLTDLVFAGNATPEAALQSMLAFQRDGDLDGVTSLMLFPPDKAKEWRELVATPEARNELTQQLIDASRGAVMRSAVEVNEAGSVVRTEEGIDRSGESHTTIVEVLQKAPIDEHRVQFSLRTARGDDIRSESFTYGLTPRGWKAIP